MPKKFLYRVEILNEDHTSILNYFVEDKFENIKKKLYELKGLKISNRTLTSLVKGEISHLRSKFKNIFIKQEEIKPIKPGGIKPQFTQHPTFIKLKINIKK